jgi:hypothetical protein
VTVRDQCCLPAAPYAKGYSSNTPAALASSASPALFFNFHFPLAPFQRFSPATPLFPLHTTIPPVSPLSPLDTKIVGWRGSLLCPASRPRSILELPPRSPRATHHVLAACTICLYVISCRRADILLACHFAAPAPPIDASPIFDFLSSIFCFRSFHSVVPLSVPYGFSAYPSPAQPFAPCTVQTRGRGWA